MPSHNCLLRFGIIALLTFLPNGFRARSQIRTTQDDTVLIADVVPPPLVDGKGDDKCWQDVPWQRIGQVWIPYGAHVDSDDYFGRYKVVWSSATNLLYFLIEVHDNVFVDGYAPGVTADIYNFDIGYEAVFMIFHRSNHIVKPAIHAKSELVVISSTNVLREGLVLPPCRIKALGKSIMGVRKAGVDCNG